MDVNPLGKHRLSILALVLVVLTASAERQTDTLPVIQPAAVQLLALVNQARAAAGAPDLKWDDSLAVAARKHCQRMASEGPIGHRYPGELDLSERAGLAGAHFDLIEENVAIGTTADEIHDAWMHSKGHRENMLNPDVDRVGISVVASRGVLYATADYSHGVQALSQAEVVEHIASLIRPSGVTFLANPVLAREACPMDNGLPRISGSAQPAFVIRWEDSDLTRLPKALSDRLASGRYRQATVGSCDPSGAVGTFTAYRVVVLLY